MWKSALKNKRLYSPFIIVYGNEGWGEPAGIYSCFLNVAGPAD